MLRFQFSFTKATKFLWALPSANQWKKMCKDLLYGVSWQRWLLLRDWTELGAFVLCKGVKGTEWVTKNLWLGTTKIKKKSHPPVALICLDSTALSTEEARGNMQLIQKSASDVKCLFQGHLWGRDFHIHYSCVQACIQNHSSATNSCRTVLKTTDASLKLFREGESSRQFQTKKFLEKIIFAN